MARVKLRLPDSFLFSTDIRVRISDINYGGHLGNDSLLSLLHEARVRFLAQYGLTELGIYGASLITADAVVVYRSEAFQGEVLKVEMALGGFNRYGCDFLYRLTETASGREVARAKIGMVFFDYQRRRLRRLPEPFYALFHPQPEPA